MRLGVQRFFERVRERTGEWKRIEVIDYPGIIFPQGASAPENRGKLFMVMVSMPDRERPGESTIQLMRLPFPDGLEYTGTFTNQDGTSSYKVYSAGPELPSIWEAWRADGSTPESPEGQQKILEDLSEMEPASPLRA